MSDHPTGESHRENAQARVDFRVPVILEGDDSLGTPLQQRTYVENVTRRGAFIRTSSTLLPGALLSLQDADDYRNRICYIQVVWVRAEAPAAGIGVKLIGDNTKWIDYLVAHSVEAVDDEAGDEAAEN